MGPSGNLFYFLTKFERFSVIIFSIIFFCPHSLFSPFGLQLYVFYVYMLVSNRSLRLYSCFFNHFPLISSDCRLRISFHIFFFFLFLFRATLVAHGSPQEAKGPIGATATGLCHSHSNAESEPHLWPIPQLPAMLDPYPLSEARDWTCIFMDPSRVC